MVPLKDQHIKLGHKVLPGLGASPTLTFSQDIGHPLAGESYVAFADPLPELPRHQAHHLFVVLSITKGTSINEQRNNNK